MGKKMESVRKDIECFFGRLKGRWRILKTPISFHSKEKVDNVFFTCVALQNIIQDWDKQTHELTSWEVDADWTGSGGLFEDEEDGDAARLWCRPKLRRANKVNEFFVPNPTDDFSDFGGSSIPIGATRSLGRTEPSSGEQQRYEAKQKMLVQHHTYAQSAHAVQWLRS